MTGKLIRQGRERPNGCGRVKGYGRLLRRRRSSLGDRS